MKAVLVIDIPDDRKPEEYTVDRIWEYVPDEDDDRPYALYMGRKKVLRFKPLPQKKVPYFDPNASTYDEEIERSIMNEIDGYNRCIDEILGETE